MQSISSKRRLPADRQPNGLSTVCDAPRLGGIGACAVGEGDCWGRTYPRVILAGTNTAAVLHDDNTIDRARKAVRANVLSHR